MKKDWDTGANKYILLEGKIFIVGCHLVSVEGMIELENHHFVTITVIIDTYRNQLS